METLDGRTMVVTGAASGIGRSTAVLAAAEGARLVIGDRDADGARATAAIIIDSGGAAVAMPCDVADPDAFHLLKAAALESFGRVDVVMNNVGVLTRGRPEHIPLQEWQRVIDINLLSVVRSNEVFIPLLLEQGSGHIVNTASFAGLITYSYDRLPYAATKAAIVQMSEGLRLYLAPQGVGVTVLCPGPVLTNIILSLPPSFGPEVELRGPRPRFSLLEPDVVGRQVVDAVLQDRFMVVTDEAIQELLERRATDWDGYIAEQTARLSQGR